MPGVKRNYKDSLFRKLFSEKEELLSLYNALNGTTYEDVNLLEINTIEDVLYMGYKNDISLLLDFRLGIYEHQSTWCGNIPVRNFMYGGKIFAKILSGQNLYREKVIKLPNPHFVVFYNGLKECPERDVMRLSDAFMYQDEEPNVELKVLVLNINEGYNEELMSKCPKLREYSYCIARIREYRSQGYKLEKAIDLAVVECIKNDVLKDFLLEHREEVRAMCLAEYNEEVYIKDLLEDRWEEGHELGHAQGHELGRELGHAQGHAQGHEIGRTEERLENAVIMRDVLSNLGLSRDAVIEQLGNAMMLSSEDMKLVMNS